MNTPERGAEFSRELKVRPLPAAPVELEADKSERAALAARFGIEQVKSLTATIRLEDRGSAIVAKGSMDAAIVQNCAISLEDFPVAIHEKLDLRFVSPRDYPDEPDTEIEIATDELDEIEFTGDTFDLGEAVAQTLGLAIDPYATAPNADAVRAEAGLSNKPQGGAFSGLEDLLKN